MDLHDSLIAGIALARQATLVTRHLRHDQDLCQPVIKPLQGLNPDPPLSPHPTPATLEL